MNKIKVLAKAQNRICLGIVHAYMAINPNSTLEDLRKSFPNNLNPDKGVKENFIYVDEKGTDANWDGYFREDEEVITTGDNKKVSVVKMWTKPSFDRMVAHAENYEIVSEILEKTEKDAKARFRLEFINGFTVTENKAKSKFIPLLFAALIITAILAAILMI